MHTYREFRDNLSMLQVLTGTVALMVLSTSLLQKKRKRQPRNPKRAHPSLEKPQLRTVEALLPRNPNLHLLTLRLSLNQLLHPKPVV